MNRRREGEATERLVDPHFRLLENPAMTSRPPFSRSRKSQDLDASSSPDESLEAIRKDLKWRRRGLGEVDGGDSFSDSFPKRTMVANWAFQSNRIHRGNHDGQRGGKKEEAERREEGPEKGAGRRQRVTSLDLDIGGQSLYRKRI